MQERQCQTDIFMGVVLRTALLGAGIWFLYLIREIVLLVFVAILIVAAINPLVGWMQKKGIPRTAGVFLVYVIVILMIGLSVSFLIPPLVSQFNDFSQKAPTIVQKTLDAFGAAQNFFQEHNISLGQQDADISAGNQVSSLPSTIFSGTVGLVSGAISTLIVFVMAFYMTVNEDGIKKFIVSITPGKHKEYAASATQRIEEKIGKWTQGQFFLMFFIFILDFIWLSILGVPYALALALFAGLMEIIPYIGPIVSAIPGVILASLISPLTGFIALLLYFLTQQFENHVIVPQVMKKAVGLNPIAVMVALLIGLKLGGVMGAILAIPLATAISIFITDFMKKHEM
ncbi:MAG: hypothetical protein UT50_C0009G0020 [Candidatus Moranbacteria bacterium GW2011_GWA2_39_41]|nr:MAG: hypothetical protein UT50_C0009G0020 [Candidatus Moranbacteria bacterium GW2011_GWA2_39_41]